MSIPIDKLMRISSGRLGAGFRIAGKAHMEADWVWLLNDYEAESLVIFALVSDPYGRRVGVDHDG